MPINAKGQHMVQPFEPTRSDYEPLELGADKEAATEYLTKLFDEHGDDSLTMLIADVIAGAFVVKNEMSEAIGLGLISTDHFSAALMHLANEAALEVVRRVTSEEGVEV